MKLTYDASGIVTINIRMKASQTNALMYSPMIRNSAGNDAIILAFQANGTFGVLNGGAWQSLRAYSANQWYIILLNKFVFLANFCAGRQLYQCFDGRIQNSGFRIQNEVLVLF